jgi:hypothetical protein
MLQEVLWRTSLIPSLQMKWTASKTKKAEDDTEMAGWSHNPNKLKGMYKEIKGHSSKAQIQ